jgi:hypothetical protein
MEKVHKINNSRIQKFAIFKIKFAPCDCLILLNTACVLGFKICCVMTVMTIRLRKPKHHCETKSMKLNLTAASVCRLVGWPVGLVVRPVACLVGRLVGRLIVWLLRSFFH